jgi:hypothetical protein
MEMPISSAFPALFGIRFTLPFRQTITIAAMGETRGCATALIGAAKAGYPARRSFANNQITQEYRIARRSLSSGGARADPVAADNGQCRGDAPKHSQRDQAPLPRTIKTFC